MSKIPLFFDQTSFRKKFLDLSSLQLSKLFFSTHFNILSQLKQTWISGTILFTSVVSPLKKLALFALQVLVYFPTLHLFFISFLFVRIESYPEKSFLVVNISLTESLEVCYSSQFSGWVDYVLLFLQHIGIPLDTEY